VQFFFGDFPQHSFDHEEVKKEVERIIEQTLMTNQYQAKKVHEWSSTIVENCVKNLQTFNKPFKYVGACRV
jgi:dynein light chain Tctex-type 1